MNEPVFLPIFPSILHRHYRHLLYDLSLIDVYAKPQNQEQVIVLSYIAFFLCCFFLFLLLNATVLRFNMLKSYTCFEYCRYKLYFYSSNDNCPFIRIVKYIVITGFFIHSYYYAAVDRTLYACCAWPIFICVNNTIESL